MIGILKRFWRDELGGFTPGFFVLFLSRHRRLWERDECQRHPHTEKED